MRRTVSVGSVVLVVLLVGAAACTGSDEPEGPIVGVNDVTKACDIRTGWSRLGTQPCSNCLGISVVARCPCSTEDYAGKCAEQNNVKNVEPTCAGTGECVQACPAGDCACADACYANKDACRKKASALDGCLAAVCDSHCR